MTGFAKVLRGLAFAPVIFASVAPSAAQDAAKPYWLSIGLSQQSGDAPGLLRRALALGDIGTWITAADFPADRPTGTSSGFVKLRISIDVRGGIGRCEVAGLHALSADIGDWACAMVRQRGKFRPALSLDGKPVADIIEMGVGFNLSTNPIPSAPPAPPMGWRGKYRPGITLVSGPAPGASQDPALTGSTVVNVSLWQKQDGTFNQPDCRVERSSGDSRIDEASCAAAAKSVYAFVRPGSFYGSMELLVRWENGRVQFETPKRDQVTPVELRFDPPFLAPDLPFTETGYFALALDPRGRIGCRVRRSTGNDALDIAICRQVTAQARFTPEISIFGEEVATELVYRLSPEDRSFASAR